jgi:hypothetical protein
VLLVIEVDFVVLGLLSLVAAFDGIAVVFRPLVVAAFDGIAVVFRPLVVAAFDGIAAVAVVFAVEFCTLGIGFTAGLLSIVTPFRKNAI